MFKHCLFNLAEDKYRDDEDELKERTSNPSRNPSSVTNPNRGHVASSSSITNGDMLGQLHRKDYSRDALPSYMTSRPMRDGSSSHLSEHSTATNLTNLTDSRVVRETERRFLNDTPNVAPYRSEPLHGHGHRAPPGSYPTESHNNHRVLLPGSHPARLTHVDVRVPSNYHPSAGGSSSNYHSAGGVTNTALSNYVGAGIDRHLSNGIGGRHTSSAPNIGRHGLVIGSGHSNVVTAGSHGNIESSSSSSGSQGRGNPVSQGGLTSSNTTFTIPSSSKATIRSLKSQLQKDKGKTLEIIIDINVTLYPLIYNRIMNSRHL